MKAMRMLAVAACALLASACSTLSGEPSEADRAALSTAQARAEAARATAAQSATDARRERVQAIATLGAGADASRVAALMLLAVEDRPPVAPPPVMQAPPPRASGGLLREVLLPVLGIGAQVYGIHEGAATSRHLSDNATRLGIAQSADQADVLLGSYTALSDTAAQIQAPAGSVEYAIGGDGVIGAGSFTTSVSTTTTNTASGAGSSTGGAGSWSTDDHSLVDDHSATAPPTVVQQQVVQVPVPVAP